MTPITFSEVLYQRRKDLKLSLSDLSKLTNISGPQINRYENFKFQPSFNNALKLSKALGFSLDHLIILDIPNERGNRKTT